MKFFFIFINLPLRILTPYSVAFFVFSGVAFSKRATISALVSSANLAAILNFITHRIWAEILQKEPIRELRCHYLVTCVCNKLWYTMYSVYRRGEPVFWLQMTLDLLIRPIDPQKYTETTVSSFYLTRSVDSKSVISSYSWLMEHTAVMIYRTIFHLINISQGIRNSG